MIARLVTIAIIIQLAACSTMKRPDSTLLSSLNIGVLGRDTSSLTLAKALFSNAQLSVSGTPNTIDEYTNEELMRRLAQGDIDVAIGLFSNRQGLSPFSTTRVAVKTIPFGYYVSTENRHLSLFNNEAALARHVKSIGYISDGDNAGINKAAMGMNKNTFLFIPCGTANECKMALLKGEIDTLFSVVTTADDIDVTPLSYQSLHPTPIQPTLMSTSIVLNYQLCVFVNTLTMSQQERAIMTNWLSHYLDE
ncbi:MAG: hypothetical protein HWE26_17535 [Alteromonadaceae bacterium]|nr:hypothetical protein [Alteromonadaceae bacterium]